MIIDRILDRKDREHDGEEYIAREFYFDVLGYGQIGDDITMAMDYGTEEDVKRALCSYIDKNDYNPDIKKYINSRMWLTNQRVKPKITFVWNGIKEDGALHKCWYLWHGTEHSGYPIGTITICAKNYRPLPRIDGLVIENDSDIMTDYFDDDRIRVTPDHPYYPQVKAAYDRYNEHYNKVRAR